MNPLIPIVAHYGIDTIVCREAARTKPAKYSSREAYGPLAEAYDSLVRERNPDVEPIQIERPVERVPADTFAGKYDAYANSSDYLASGPTKGGREGIIINPNADRSMFAHELGHIASKQTGPGKFVSNLRNNPALKRSLVQAALMTVPAGTIAALNPGDDDTAASVAVSLAAASPTIVDEFLASKNGLAIMDKAGMRATLGQRGKLAGGLLSYIATPIAMSAAANYAGNIVDEDQQTTATMPIN